MAKILFSPFKLRNLEFKNRIVVSPMCQYSAVDGVPNEWHLVHLGSRAVGGAGVVMVEATAVEPRGRISLGDLGIWNEKQVEEFKKITRFIKSQNSIAAIQIAHAGRKASAKIAWEGHGSISVQEGGWATVAPSALQYSEAYTMPHELSSEEIQSLKEKFILAAKNALQAEFQVIEIHMAHGYLLNQFLSPLTNQRKDKYGGSIENRMSFPLEVASSIRKIWPKDLPVFVRISATDWVEGGWTLEDSVIFVQKLKDIGIDLIDCSSGGTSPDQKIKIEPGYQVHLSEGVKKGADIPTGAVGLITQASHAEEILQSNKADLIFLARELLRDPYWPLHAARELKVDIPWPDQYLRAKEY